MRTLSVLSLILLSTAPVFAAETAAPANNTDVTTLRKIYDTALGDDVMYERLRELVTRYPGRLAGSKNLVGAVEWTHGLLEKQGVDRTALQPVTVPHWERGAPESVTILDAAGGTAALSALALGGSVPTPEGGVTASVIELQSLDDLPKADVKGKIVFFNRPMRRQDVIAGTSYGGAGDQRSRGPAAAAKYGAVAVLTRSLTHAIDDFPHTGNTTYSPDAPKIPAAALSTIAANRLSALLRTQPTTQVRMVINSRWFEPAQSHNVIGELRGSESPEKIIVVGGHLDSWDVAPGAHDDGAGIVQSMEVLRIFQTIGYKPKHTIRCVLYTNEENTTAGGKEYARVAGEKKETHLFALESDNGGFEPRRIELGNAAGDAAQRATAKWAPLLAPYHLVSFYEGKGGADVSQLFPLGVTTGEIVPDSQRYFDIHHTTADTIDKVNPRELQLGAAAMAALVYLYDQHGL